MSRIDAYGALKSTFRGKDDISAFVIVRDTSDEIWGRCGAWRCLN